MTSYAEDLVPAWIQGGHSTVGRSSNRGMDKMRAIAIELEEQSNKAAQARKETAERIAAERAQGSTGGGSKPVGKLPAAAISASAARSPQAAQEEAAPTPKKKSLAGKTSPAAQDKNSTPMGRAVRERLNINPGSPTAAAGQGADPQSPTGLSLQPDNDPGHQGPRLADEQPKAKRETPSHAFAANGPSTQSGTSHPLNETGKVHMKVFFNKGRNLHTSPEPGHYRVLDTLLQKREPTADFGLREKTPSRRSWEVNHDSLGPEDLTTLDVTFTKSGTLFAQPSIYSTATHPGSLSESSLSTWKGQSVMSTATARPALNNIIGSRMALKSSFRMSDQNSEPQNIENAELKTGHFMRPPVWDLTRQTGRKGIAASGECQFYEVGKYGTNGKHAPSIDAVMPIAKKQIGLHLQTSRSTPVATHSKPQALLDEKGTSYHPDRSQYRQAVRATRITHVMDMAKDTDRPPMVKPPPVLHDASDPEVARAVHERQMTFDADAGRNVVDHRRDFCLNMSQSMSRDRAGHGARIAQEDVAIRQLQGYTGTETAGQLCGTVEQLKDKCSATRKMDTGVSFDKCKARNPTRLKGAYSSLHRPRDHAAPDFSRTTIAGFDSRTSVKRDFKVLARSRTHDAMPGWNADVVDGIMGED